MAIVSRYSTRALDEIDETAELLAVYSPSYAKLFINSIFAKVELLRGFPHLGRQVPEVGDEAIWELLLKRYRIFYQI